MSRFRKIDPRIWNDEKFRGLSDHGKLAFLFVLTHPHMTSLGAMRATIDGMISELGWTGKGYAKGFMEPFEKGILRIDEKACFVWAPNFIKYNPPDNKNVVVAWAKCIDLLPECPMKNTLISHVSEYLETLPKGFAEPFPKPFPKGMPIQETEKEQEQEQENTSSLRSEGAPVAPPAPDSTEPPKKKSSAKSDAVNLFRETFNRFPNKVQMATIDQTVTDLRLWRETIEYWALKGWNPANVAGMLERYQNGNRDAAEGGQEIYHTNPPPTQEQVALWDAIK
jgi:hypothetical protein